MELTGIWCWLPQDFFQYQLTDGHLGIEDNVAYSKVLHFKSERPIPICVNCWGGEVHQQTASRERTLPLNPGGERSHAGFNRQFDVLQRLP